MIRVGRRRRRSTAETASSAHERYAWPVPERANRTDAEGVTAQLLDYIAGPKTFANLLLVRIEGTIAWQAPPPDQSSNDAFVELGWDGDDLVANSWSGYRVSFDSATGAIKGQAFVK